MRTVRTAGGLVFDEHGRVLLIRTEIPDTFGLVKGHIELGETLEQAAIRELKEETGYEGEIVSWLGGLNRKSAEDTGVVDKHIDMFLMQITGGKLGSSEEDPVWLDPAVAIEHMKHPEEAAFLRTHIPKLPSNA